MAANEEKEVEGNGSLIAKQVIEKIESAGSLGSKKLDLSRRLIKEIPTELKSLQKLEYLYLEGNSFQYLPDDFFTCLHQLKWLDLRNNKLLHLPINIGQARFLRSLLLENNELEELPLELGFVQTLSGLHLAGNPLKFPPSNITEQGTQVIINFLRELLLKRQRAVQEPSQSEESESAQSESSNAASSRSHSGEERAQPNPSLKLPPIVDKQFLIEPNSVDTRAACDDFQSSYTVNEKFRVVGPIGIGGVAGNVKEKRYKQESIKKVKSQQSTSKEKASPNEFAARDGGLQNRKVTQSPKKVTAKQKKKGRLMKEAPSKKVIMKAKVNETGTIDLNYEGLTSKEESEEKSVEKESTVGLSEKLAKIMDEERTQLRKVRELISSTAETESKQDENIKRNLDDLAVDDMIAIQVSERHFIPGQPCLGKVVSLPDKAGVVLVHYYSGRYDGDWRPMMSRSSPYLRRVPVSKIICKFKLDGNNRMSQETAKEVQDTIENNLY